MTHVMTVVEGKGDHIHNNMVIGRAVSLKS